MKHPRRALRDPLEGAASAARQSRFRDASGLRKLTRGGWIELKVES